MLPKTTPPNEVPPSVLAWVRKGAGSSSFFAGGGLATTGVGDGLAKVGAGFAIGAGLAGVREAYALLS